MASFQQQIRHNPCFGCGHDNPQGLGINSYWSESHPDIALCEFTPQAHHTAGSVKFINGGILATIIDCHCVCTAIAHAYQTEHRNIGSSPAIWFATGSLNLSYKRPAPLTQPVLLKAWVTKVEKQKTFIECELFSGEKLCVTATLVAVKVDEQWMK